MGALSDYLSSRDGLVVLVGLVILYTVIRVNSSPLRSLPLPPGPPVSNWLSGHLSILPSSQTWKVYTNWAKFYGLVMHIRVYGGHTIFLSSLDDCIEVFERRSNLYSDKPKLAMVDLMGWNIAPAMMQYGPRWRKHRSLFQQAFKRVTALSYRQEQSRKVNDMLQNLLTSPDDFRAHIKTLAAAIVMSVTYGYDIKFQNDEFVDLAEEATTRLDLALSPGAALVNDVPILRYLPAWFPGAGFHSFASRTKEITTRMQEAPLDWVQKNLEMGTQATCIVSKGLSTCQTDQDLVALKEFAAVTYAAAADTTATALSTFFYVMTIFPDVQKIAQQELETVIGTERLPTYDDWQSLPYIEALLRETLRWRPVLPLGMAHSTTEDDIFKGYLIPKGSVIVPNVWAISRDKNRYIDPEVFNPARFLDKDGNLNSDDVTYTFGFGRRVCPGRHMARATLWLSMATILSTFDITKAKDQTGNEIPVEVEYTDTFISRPHPHACDITPRSPQSKVIVEEAAARTRERHF